MIDPVNLLFWRYLQFCYHRSKKPLLDLHLRAESSLQIKFWDTYSDVRFIRDPKELGRSPVRLLNDRSLANSTLYEYAWHLVICISWWKANITEPKTHISLICSPENTFPRGPVKELWLKFLEDRQRKPLLRQNQWKRKGNGRFGIRHLQVHKRCQKR